MLHYFLVLSCFSSVLLLFYFSFIPYFFLVLFLLFLYVFNGRSPADLADYADECSKAAYFADKRQLAQMYLLKQMPQITLRKTVTT